MATYTVLSEGNPIVPINMEISFPVNHTVAYTDAVISNKDGVELQEQFEDYVLDKENQHKENADFSTQDSNRNATFVLTPVGDAGGGYTNYTCAYTFTIENAVITIERQTQTDLTGTAKDDYLESFANGIEAAYIAERPWVAL